MSESPAGAALADVTINGVRLACKQFSGGAPKASGTIVFLHDSLGCITLWRHFPESLVRQTGTNALIYDRQGYGASGPFTSKRDPDYLHKEAQVLLALLDLLKIENPILFGHSDGGTIALLAAAMEPQRISAVITEGAHVFVEELTLDGIRQAVETYRTTDLGERLKRYHGEKAADVFSAWADTWLSERFRDWNVESMLSSIICPVLVMQGENDEFGTEKQVDSIVRQVSGPAEKFMVKDAAHTPHKEAAGLTLQVCVRFLERVIGAKAP